jgi:signal transduction histidine kinase
MKNIFFLFFFGLISISALGQTISETVQGLSEKEYRDYIKNNFYTIRSQNMDTALVYIERGLLVARDAQDAYFEGWCYMEKGIIHYLSGDYPKALKSYQAGLKIAEKLKDKALIGNILKELGNYTKQQKAYKKAHEYLARSERLCGEAGDSICLASANGLRGVVYEFEGNLDSAEIKFKAAFELKQQLKDTLGLAYAYNDLAGIARLKNDFVKAIELIKKSTAIRTQINDIQGLAIDLNNIGEVYLGMKNMTQAVAYFEQSLAVSRSLKYTDLTRHTLSLASEASLKMGDYRTAFEYLKESTALNDSLYSIEKEKMISEMQTKYETEKQAQTIKNQTLELAKNKAVIRQQQLVGVSILSILLLISLIIYYRFYQKRKYEKQIQKLIIIEKLQSERARISRDLHDNVGASLTSIITKLDVIAYKARKSNVEKVSNSVEKVNQGARETMQQLRETIWAIKKDSYTMEDFSKKIQEYLQKYLEEIPGLQWNVNVKGDLEKELSPSQVLNLFRIIQEATQNTLKYANASRLMVTFENSEKLTLKIEDNGDGFDLKNTDLEGHYGLENMKQRAEDIGGFFRLKTAIQKGVLIEIVL